VLPKQRKERRRHATTTTESHMPRKKPPNRLDKAVPGSVGGTGFSKPTVVAEVAGLPSPEDKTEGVQEIVPAQYLLTQSLLPGSK